jgi:hypothetical protein
MLMGLSSEATGVDGRSVSFGSTILDVDGFDPLPALGSNRRGKPEVERLD